MSLYELLAEMNVAGPVVAEIKTVEDTANTAISLSTATIDVQSFEPPLRKIGRKIFDYSTNDGKVSVGEGVRTFVLRFAKASSDSIHFHRNGTNLARIARIKQELGPRVPWESLDSSSRTYTLRVGDRFMAQNDLGYLLVGRVLEIKDDSRGSPNDEVVFTYVIRDQPLTDASAE
jgi:hypothetical protein